MTPLEYDAEHTAAATLTDDANNAESANDETGNRRRQRGSKTGSGKINLQGGRAGGEEEDGDGDDDGDDMAAGLIQKARLFPSPFHR